MRHSVSGVLATGRPEYDDEATQVSADDDDVTRRAGDAAAQHGRHASDNLVGPDKAVTMAKKPRQHDEEAWRKAKTICRLNTRQIEALGMNPRKLPRLRPDLHERWKLPVGTFIEECYRKQFGVNPQDRKSGDPQPDSPHGPSDAPAVRTDRAATFQVEELVCYLMNLADDLQKWLAHGQVTEVSPQVSEELRDVARARDTRAWISAIPEILLPPRSVRAALSRGRAQKAPPWDEEDDIPF